MTLKQLSAAAVLSAATLLCAGPASASYANYGGAPSIDFTFNSTAWTLGGGVRSSASGNPAPGSASWSVMAAGLADASGVDAHGGGLTSLLSSLYVGGVDETATIALVLNTWAAVSGFSSLGQVADGGGGLGAAGAAGGAGHIRVGAIFIDGNVGSNVLAHAFNPCDATTCGAGGNIGGDMHFDNGNLWSDGGAPGTIDFQTVALHELGHALGLGHSTVVGSVMEATYAGVRRTLTADDIAGIRAIYGVAVPVPEPATYLLMAMGAMGVLGLARRKQAA
jgi:hypothetical protein